MRKNKLKKNYQKFQIEKISRKNWAKTRKILKFALKKNKQQTILTKNIPQKKKPFQKILFQIKNVTKNKSLILTLYLWYVSTSTLTDKASV